MTVSSARRRVAVVVCAAATVTAVAAAPAGASTTPAVHTAAQAAGARASLESSARLPGTAWSVDEASHTVVVSVFTNASATTGATVRRLAAASAGAIQVQLEKGALTRRLTGGQAIYGGGYRCSVGFNVRSGSTYYFLTAGHCGNLTSTWYTNSGQTAVAGTTADSRFPGDDYALVRYASGVTHPGSVSLYNGGGTQDISTAVDATVGESVRRSGSTTGVHSGVVQALNATVNYSEGTVTGLIRTNVCAEGGDSGGALFDGTKAVGLTSGGSGDCTSGGTTYFQPVTEALSRYGVSVY